MISSETQSPPPRSCRAQQNSISCGCRTEVPTFLQAVRQGLLSAPRICLQFLGTWPSHNMAASNLSDFRNCLLIWGHLLRSVLLRTTSLLINSESADQYLIMEVKSHYIYKSHLYSRGGVYTGHEYQGARMLGDILEFCLPQHIVGK